MPYHAMIASGTTPRRLLTEEERQMDRLRLLRDILESIEAAVGTIEGDRSRARIHLCCHLLMKLKMETEERNALATIEVAASSLYSKRQALEAFREALRRQIRECCDGLKAAWGEQSSIEPR